MPREFIYIKPDTIHSAAREILSLLEDTTKGNVMYFYGWYGLGTSAIMKVVVKHLKSSTARNGMADDPRSKLFDKVIHVDCSVWKSRRALQKVIAEELELPQSVMIMFDQYDEDDDFKGVDQGSREEIKEVTWEIFANLAAHRVVVVLHNGSKTYIDLNSFGISVHANLRNKVLWTDCGRFCPGEYEMPLLWNDELMGSTNAFIYGRPLNAIGIDEGLLWGFVHEEAKEVAEYTGMSNLLDHRVVEECILYMWALKAMERVDWETHASNYWVCDGIIQGDRSAWEIGDALQSYIHLDMNWEYMDRAAPFSTAHLRSDVPRQPPICQSSSWSVSSVPPDTNSFFMEGDDKGNAVLLTAGMFQHSDNSNLRVLHLSFCTFSFASPPFLCCRNLRFLLLHCCKDDTSNSEETDQNHSHSGSWKACFRKLWVLDLNYTELYRLLSEDMINVMADLRELNVKGLKQWHITNLHGSITSLVKLRVTSCSPVPAGDDDTNNQVPFPNLSGANNLKMIILDGCDELGQISHHELPQSLESFSFINNIVDASKLSTISFCGCSKLKSILLRGCLGKLEELDLSGTAVKTLDLREVEAPNLECLILLGCKKLHAILWPPEHKMMKILKVVRIDTNRCASISGQDNLEENSKEASFATGSSSIAVVDAAATRPGISQAISFDFSWCISVRDARLLRSLVDVHEQYYYHVHMEIDSSPVCKVAIGSREVSQGTRSIQQPNKYLDIRHVVFRDHLQVGAISWMWDFPPSPAPATGDLSVHIQDENELKIGLLQQDLTSLKGTSTSVSPPKLICDYARMLYVHDSMFITTINSSPHDTIWESLQWCRVERCRKLHTVFRTQSNDSQGIFKCLETFWASHLPAARYIWNWSSTFEFGAYSFQQLRLLYLDFCPRVIHVLPLYMYWNPLLRLETLKIECCSDLREVFPLDLERPRHPNAIGFPMLRHIHLLELPALKRICGCHMLTPNLETVKIRGCWSLKRLPAISDNTKPPKVDCEKEWWDSLEWDGLDEYHHPSLYRATHSVYYKKTHMPRGTLLM